MNLLQETGFRSSVNLILIFSAVYSMSHKVKLHNVLNLLNLQMQITLIVLYLQLTWEETPILDIRISINMVADTALCSSPLNFLLFSAFHNFALDLCTLLIS